MSEVYIIVEGPTEQTFVRDLLAPYLAVEGVYCHAFLLGERGSKGGNVTFLRAKKNIELCLKQRDDTYVTTLFDYYGIDPNWPGKSSVLASFSPQKKLLLHPEEVRYVNPKSLPYIQDSRPLLLLPNEHPFRR